MSQHGDRAAMVAAAATGRTLEEIASASQMSRSTVQRRLREPDVRREILEFQAAQRQLNAARTGSLVEKALMCVEEVMKSSETGLRLRAAALVLGTVSKTEQVTDLEQRIATLEDPLRELKPLSVDEAAVYSGDPGNRVTHVDHV